MNIAWDPLILAALIAACAGCLYHFTGWARTTGLVAAAALAALVVAVPPLSKLAHHPVSSGFPLMVVIVGAVIFAALFVVVIILGQHGPLRKQRRKPGSAVATSAQGGAAQASASKSAHPKAAHHRAMVITVGAMAFIFALVTSWHPAANAVQHGVSQTYNGITQ
jgi:uncharacterized integral membrane protein